MTDFFQDLVGTAWRETGLHLDAQGVADALAERLRRRLAFAWLLARSVEVEGAAWAVETRAGISGRGEAVPFEPRRLLDADLHGRWLAWARVAEPFCAPVASVEAVLPGLLPREARGEVAVVPLLAEGEPVGLLAAAAPPGASPGPELVQLLQALREPFATAVANDRRVAALERRSEAAEAERRALLSRLGQEAGGAEEPVIGAETGLRVVMQRVDLVAPSDAPVLILGETGAGKEVIARRIHERSARASGPFLRVNCGAIPAELIDSELFGHERGSFTGASARRQGWFERADGGTLFLDEVGELSPDAQVRLLRILQDGTFQRVGGQSELRVDVRLVAATHRDLRAMVAAGQFRQDLWYRIAVFPLDLPPLRERREDIPALAAHFALRAARRFGLRPRLPTPEDELLLVRYHWPGNVRELASVMERAALLGQGRALAVAPAIGAPTAAQASEASRANPGGDAPFPTLDAVLADHIAAALRRCHGRIEGRSGAARLLGINPHTLRARMRKLGIDWSRYRAGAAD